jgi:uncharacterized membrane protein YdjX (TVP38/TMEM64 family)
MTHVLPAPLRRLSRRRSVQILAGAVALAALVLATNPGVRSSLAALASGDRESLRSFILGFGPLAPVASIVLNVFQGVLAPIPGFVVPFVNGVVFGTWMGMLVTWIGGIAAAATCFGISRTVGRSFAERMCGRSAIADQINRRIQRHAFGAVFLGRFLPGMPFDALSYIAGLTRIPFRTYILATALGSAPHAYLYAYAGASLHIPVWVGILVMPALCLAVSAVHALIVRLRRRSRTAVAAAPRRAPSTARRAVPLHDWLTPTDSPACAGHRATAWSSTTAPASG